MFGTTITYRSIWLSPKLVKGLAVVAFDEWEPEIIIVDAQQLLYHVVWQQGGAPADLVASIQGRLVLLTGNIETILVFDKYSETSVKDHERLRRSSVPQMSYDLSITSPLPKKMPFLTARLTN